MICDDPVALEGRTAALISTARQRVKTRRMVATMGRNPHRNLDPADTGPRLVVSDLQHQLAGVLPGIELAQRDHRIFQPSVHICAVFQPTFTHPPT